MTDAHETHDVFFQVISPKKLNELLHRSDKNTKVLEEHINEELKHNEKPFICTTDVSNDKTGCHIYIDFFNINNNKIGHISFHLISDNKDMGNYSRKVGRFHVRNNRNRNCYYPLTFKKENDSMKIFLTYPVPMRQELKECIEPTIEILNSYFDETSDIRLSKKMTTNSDTDHKCLKIIRNNVNTKKKTKLNPTRKRKPYNTIHTIKSVKQPT